MSYEVAACIVLSLQFRVNEVLQSLDQAMLYAYVALHFPIVFYATKSSISFAIFLSRA